MEIWTDGSCSGNPGRGGFAAYIKHGHNEYAVCGSDAYTTNNRMELRGFLAACLAASDIDPKNMVTIYTDSKYVENAINCGWLQKWEKKGYKDIKNSDIWHQIFIILNKVNVSVVWVKGHSDSKENEIADRLANEARDGVHGKQSIIYF
jgi:ribonuclease HI